MAADDYYQLPKKVKARFTNEPESIRTPEGRVSVVPPAWIVTDENGYQFAVSDARFQADYTSAKEAGKGKSGKDLDFAEPVGPTEDVPVPTTAATLTDEERAEADRARVEAAAVETTPGYRNIPRNIGRTVTEEERRSAESARIRSIAVDDRPAEDDDEERPLRKDEVQQSPEQERPLRAQTEDTSDQVEDKNQPTKGEAATSTKMTASGGPPGSENVTENVAAKAAETKTSADQTAKKADETKKAADTASTSSKAKK